VIAVVNTVDTVAMFHCRSSKYYNKNSSMYFGMGSGRQTRGIDFFYLLLQMVVVLLYICHLASERNGRMYVHL